mmetsp:Transcript_5273/g.9101  ORF Transcript_5273/g.9101 Transcript_5273/m.9101 type:complete len:114 (-) Transcript_5273:649-990(-)
MEHDRTERNWERCKPEVIREACLGFAKLSVVGFGGVYLAHTYWKGFRMLSKPLKFYTGLAAGLVGFSYFGERAEFTCARRNNMLTIRTRQAERRAKMLAEEAKLQAQASPISA